MEKKLIDTDIFIDFLKGKKEARVFFENEKELSTSVIVVMEIVTGLKNHHEIENFEKFLHKGKISIYSIDKKISEKAYLLFRQYQKSDGISIPDAFIAVTGLVYGEALITRNVKHFKIIKGLRIITPYK